MQKSFFLAVLMLSCAITAYADRVQIGALYYSLDETNHTAEVVYKDFDCEDNPFALLGVLDDYDSECEYNDGWSITTAIIPETVTYNGTTYRVTAIGYSAFKNCKNLRQVSIPSSIKYIGSGAFSNCPSLPVVNNLRYADTYLVTAVNKSLSTYTIREGTTWISSDAFNGCNNLTSITIPKSVKYIDQGAFSSAKNLQSIHVAADHPYFSTIDGVLFNKSRTRLLCYPARKTGDTYTIPQGVTHIDDYAFYNSLIKHLIIPKTVKSLGTSFLYKCANLSSITCQATTPPSSKAILLDTDASFTEVPKTIVIYVPSEAVNAYKAANGWRRFNTIQPIQLPRVRVRNLFYSADPATQTAELIRPTGSEAALYEQATRADIYSTFTCDGIKYTVTGLAENAFAACINLRSVSIPYTVRRIGSGAFFECYALTSITLPPSVEQIGDDVFWNCTSLSEIKCQATVPPRCSDNAFVAVKDKPLFVPAESINRYRTAPGWKAFKTIQPLERPIYTIGELYYHLDDETKTAEVTQAPQNVISNYPTLLHIDIPSTVTYKGITYTVNSIDEYTFTACTALGSVTIPSTVREIKTWAFTNTGLTHVNLPYGLKIIGEGAFYECRSLTSVTIPASVVEIRREAFSYCVNLPTITLPASVRRLDENVFACCWSMTSINMLAPTPIRATTDLDCQDHQHIKLFVPAESVQKYRLAEGWKEYEAILPIK